MIQHARSRRSAVALAALAFVLAGCGDDDTDGASSPTSEDETTSTDAASTDSASTEPSGAATDGLAVVAGEPFPEERCAANQAAGTVTFLTGFDYAAASSIVEVITADDLGYYDELCLDVEIRSSFSTANYPLVAGGEGQFASGGSFSEVVAFADANDTDLVAVTVAGTSPIDTLIVKPRVAAELSELAGATIGVKGKLQPSIEVMLLGAGLVAEQDYTTVLLDGFDPTAHIAIDSIAAFPGWKSNEPGRLTAAGIDFVQFDASDAGVPGSFGAIFTTRQFIDEHPTAAEDFVRATLRGLAAAIADPEAAAAAAVELVEAGGNPNYLSPEGEVFRWSTEAGIVAGGTPDGAAPGAPIVAPLQAEVDAYAEVGLFGDGATPSIDGRVDPSLAAAVVDDSGTVIWPG